MQPANFICYRRPHPKPSNFEGVRISSFIFSKYPNFPEIQESIPDPTGYLLRSDTRGKDRWSWHNSWKTDHFVLDDLPIGDDDLFFLHLINRIVFWSGVKENLKVGLPVKEILQMIFFLAFTGKFNR